MNLIEETYKINIEDTLRAVDMYFHWMPNDKVNNISQRQFRVTIWGDNNGKPGAMLYQDSATTPHYQYIHHPDWGNSTNVFYRYKLTTAFKVSGTIYIGWVQYSVDLLNIGFDKSIQTQNRMFYNTEGNWNNSQIQGSWMIRPVFGTRDELVNVKEVAVLNAAVKLYPNPAKNSVNVELDQAWPTAEIKVLIYDAFGRTILNEKKLYRSGEIDITSLMDGLYFIRISDNRNNSCIKKLVVTK